MTPDMTWGNIEVDHARPISSFDLCKDEELKEDFRWKNTPPFLNRDHQPK